MGCSASTALHIDDMQRVKGGERGDAGPSGVGNEVHEAAEQAADLNIMYWETKRVNMGRYLAETAESPDPLVQFQRATVACAIRSAEIAQFEPFVANGDIDACTVAIGVSNANFSCTMMKLMQELTSSLEARSMDCPPNLPISQDQLLDVLRLKNVWKRLQDASAVCTFPHPLLGSTTLILSCLQSCIMARYRDGEGSTPLPLFRYLLDQGASPNLRNSLGFTPLMLAVAAAHAGLKSRDEVAQAVREAYQSVGLVRMMVEAGADVSMQVPALGGSLPESFFTQHVLQEAVELLRASRPLDVFDMLQAFREQVQGDADFGALQPVYDDLHAALSAGRTAGAAAAPGPGASDRQMPWTRAIYNISWAVSQVAFGANPAQRRAILDQIRPITPFALPPLSVISATDLKKLGMIPKYSTKLLEEDAGSFAPTLSSSLPPGAIVTFVSHRWLGNGCPDDESGTKFKQCLMLAEHVAAKHHTGVANVYLWLDYSVVDQSNPMPGVQALPIYIACCDEFVYITHSQYWERAWCLTEQFMFWKLCGGNDKYCLKPTGAGSFTLDVEAGSERPPDPALGKLAVEKDRIALAIMSAIMPYDG